MHCGGGVGVPGWQMTKDGGYTWTQLSTVFGFSHVNAIAFGAPKTAGAYESIYVAGKRSDTGNYEVHGIHDFNPTTMTGTLTKYADFPLGEAEEHGDMVAPMDQFGMVVMNCGGTGQQVLWYDSAGTMRAS